jgi:hypothetical protein
MIDHEAMLVIQQELDGVEWTADTLERIAEIMRLAGYRIRTYPLPDFGRRMKRDNKNSRLWSMSACFYVTHRSVFSRHILVYFQWGSLNTGK